MRSTTQAGFSTTRRGTNFIAVSATASCSFAGYLPAAEVPTVAASFRQVEKSWLRERFDALSRTDYHGAPLDDDGFEAVWDCLEGLPEFYARLVDRQAAMVFTVAD